MFLFLLQPTLNLLFELMAKAYKISTSILLISTRYTHVPLIRLSSYGKFLKKV